MLEKIQASIDLLSDAEQRVGRWVLAHPRQTAESTLAEVARRAGVSEPTVVRFCRRFGVSGYRELTLRLTEALSRPVSYLHQNVAADDSSADAIMKVFDASIRALVESRAELSAQPIDAAAALLRDARQIAFIGLGASGCVAQDAWHKFFRLGIPCSALSDLTAIQQLASIAGPGDLLFFVSARGGRLELVEAAERAHSAGASVLAMTRPDSALARVASLTLACEPAEDTSIYTPMTSRLTHLVWLDALLVTLSLALGDAAADRLRASKAALVR